ncbi:MAG TPA: hypothetical protein VER96_05820 [Polyangiaceae bacterium]|nr:hypothetical protein [Polyangiaceae bacterium]
MAPPLFTFSAENPPIALGCAPVVPPLDAPPLAEAAPPEGVPVPAADTCEPPSDLACPQAMLDKASQIASALAEIEH